MISMVESDAEKEAKERFFDLCEQDAAVVTLLRLYRVSRDDLNVLYRTLLGHVQISAGRDRLWISGHYIPLSSLIYPEPLLYLLEATAWEFKPSQIANILISYWSGEGKKGWLLMMSSGARMDRLGPVEGQLPKLPQAGIQP